MRLKENRIQVKEILKFLVGGGSAVVIDYIIYQVLLSIGWNLSASKAVSYVCGAAAGFVINKLWTFESRGFSKAEIIKYVVLYAFSACVNACVNRLVVMLLGMALFAFLCATGVSTVMNFIGQKFFVFVKGRGDDNE